MEGCGAGPVFSLLDQADWVGEGVEQLVELGGCVLECHRGGLTEHGFTPLAAGGSKHRALADLRAEARGTPSVRTASVPNPEGPEAAAPRVLRGTAVRKEADVWSYRVCRKSSRSLFCAALRALYAVAAAAP